MDYKSEKGILNDAWESIIKLDELNCNSHSFSNDDLEYFVQLLNEYYKSFSNCYLVYRRLCNGALKHFINSQDYRKECIKSGYFFEQDFSLIHGSFSTLVEEMYMEYNTYYDSLYNSFNGINLIEFYQFKLKTCESKQDLQSIFRIKVLNEDLESLITKSLNLKMKFENLITATSFFNFQNEQVKADTYKN